MEPGPFAADVQRVLVDLAGSRGGQYVVHLMPLGVGMLAGVFPPSVGGIQTHTLQLGRRLVELGVEVHVLTRHHLGLPREESVDGVCVHRVGDARLPRGVRVGSYLLGAVAALRRLGRRIDLVHAHQLTAPATIGFLGRAMLGKPLVLNPHSPAELEERGAFAAMQVAAARRFGDAFISICKPITVALLRAGVDERRIHSIPNGVDIDRFQPADASGRATLRDELGLPQLPAVIYAGRLSYVKGVDVLLEAWPRLAEKAQLWLAGDGEDAAALRSQAAGLRAIRFLGRVSDCARLMRAADVAVLPSRSEGLSVALLEAMSCGLPTVATAVGGSPDVIDDGVNGMLVPPENPAALAAALIRALQTPSLGAAARSRIVQRYSIDRVIRQTVELYRALCPAWANCRAAA